MGSTRSDWYHPALLAVEPEVLTVKSRLVGCTAAAILLPVVLVACGGGGKPGAEKQRYIEQSDPICRDTFAQSASIGDAHDQQTAQKQADLWMGAADKLKALPRPSESVELASQFVTDVENIGLSYLAASRALSLKDQAKAEKAFGDVSMIKQREAKTAKEYGYTDCARING